MSCGSGFEVMPSCVLLPSGAGFFVSTDDSTAFLWSSLSSGLTLSSAGIAFPSAFVDDASLFSRKIPSQTAVCASRKISKNMKNLSFWIFDRVIVPCHLSHNNDGDDDNFPLTIYNATIRRPNAFSMLLAARRAQPDVCPPRHASSRLPAVPQRGGLRTVPCCPRNVPRTHMSSRIRSSRSRFALKTRRGYAHTRTRMHVRTRVTSRMITTLPVKYETVYQ